MVDKPVLHWLTGGLLLGGLLLVAVLAVQPLGVSTQYVRAVGGVCDLVAPAAADANPYFRAEKIVFGYAEMVVIGIPIGALIASSLFRRRTRESVPAPWLARFGPSRALRFAAAFAGGVLLLLGARLAGGCTSGHILSGVSQLAVSSILFAIAAFGTAVLTGRAMYSRGGEVKP
ncbi:MAG: YeeE/YedE thiosulfate transporter family protein [Planctomycetota bacterium]